MPSANQKPPEEREHRDFSISGAAVLSLAEAERVDFVPEAVELPRFYGDPLLFAIARDPRTVFVCWSVDWPSTFENSAPVDRQVHLRVYQQHGAEETAVAVEPMAGHCYISVSRPGATYRVELGYYDLEHAWHSVAKSEEVTMPADKVSESVDVDLATIPFHLSFQRLIDLFRANNGDALTEIISRLQRRAVSDAERDLLTPEELEILRAMNISIEEMESTHAAFGHARWNEAALRRRAETLLGLSATNPTSAFSPSSWG
jgi:hypothetical protein